MLTQLVFVVPNQLSSFQTDFCKSQEFQSLLLCGRLDSLMRTFDHCGVFKKYIVSHCLLSLFNLQSFKKTIQYTPPNQVHVYTSL